MATLQDVLTAQRKSRTLAVMAAKAEANGRVERAATLRDLSAEWERVGRDMAARINHAAERRIRGRA